MGLETLDGALNLVQGLLLLEKLERPRVMDSKPTYTLKQLFRRMSSSISGSSTVSVRTWAPQSGVTPSAIIRESNSLVRRLLAVKMSSANKLPGATASAVRADHATEGNHAPRVACAPVWSRTPRPRRAWGNGVDKLAHLV